MSVLESSVCQSWLTPPEVLDPVARFFGGTVGLDPCGHTESLVGAFTEYRRTRCEDGLSEPWTGLGGVFCNPPYGREIEAWAARCVEQAKAGAEIILLVPARVGTGWWKRHVLASSAICFWSGRIKFRHPHDGLHSSATFDSALVYFGRRPGRFARRFRSRGWIVRGWSR